MTSALPLCYTVSVNRQRPPSPPNGHVRSRAPIRLNPAQARVPHTSPLRVGVLAPRQFPQNNLSPRIPNYTPQSFSPPHEGPVWGGACLSAGRLASARLPHLYPTRTARVQIPPPTHPFSINYQKSAHLIENNNLQIPLFCGTCALFPWKPSIINYLTKTRVHVTAPRRVNNLKCHFNLRRPTSELSLHQPLTTLRVHQKNSLCNASKNLGHF